MHGCCQLVTVLLCWLTTVWAQQDDSLRGALEAISRRQRDLSDGSYYVNRGLGRLRVRPDDELQFYEGQGGFQDDGQPEDIGYGYQKSVAPHTSGIFEPVALPSSELGSHDNLGNERLLHFSEKDLERLASDYSGNTVDNNRFVYKFPRNRYPVNSKRSIFRERGDGTDSLQHLYSKHESGSDGDSARPILLPSSFRERYPGRTGLPPSALALIRNFGGLDRDPETTTGDDDSDEYLTVLNSIWEKYKNNAPEGFDPEELTESDVEELINYFGDKDEKKRFDNYGNNYDFFNSPLSWTKRSNQKLDSSPTDDGFFHALKFLSRDRDVLESLRDDDPVEDDDEDVAKVLLEQKPGLTAQYGYRDGPGYKKRFWRDVPLTDKYAYHNRVSKRFPVTKRSSNYPGSQEHNKSIKSHSEIRQRRKKNVGEGEVVTDPKVAQEINNIFSTSDTGEKDKKLNGTEINGQTHEGHSTTSKPTAQAENKGESTKEHAPNNTVKSDADHAHHMHRRDKETGQKEESDASAFSQTLDVKKKSIDWSDYFGIDRRRKKSLNKNNFNDEWLLNQYLKAYSLSNNGFVHPNDVSQFSRSQQYDSLVNAEPDYEIQKKGPDDIDNKLRAMEDLIVDEALKYTGAHEGITDTKEVQKVKDRVMTKLAAAYSLEKMRRALGEFKSSIAAQKEAMPSEHSTAKPEDKEDQKSKRVAVKKEKAELKDKKSEKKLEEDNDVNYVPPKPTHSAASNSMLHELNFNNRHQSQDDEVCPVLEDVAGRCRQISIIAGDRGDLFLPLCTLHQICYLCGSEVGTAYPGTCDISFLTEANTVCHDNAQCRFAARRMLAGMRALKGDPSPAGCDWGNNPCLARFLALATDR